MGVLKCGQVHHVEVSVDLLVAANLVAERTVHSVWTILFVVERVTVPQLAVGVEHRRVLCAVDLFLAVSVLALGVSATGPSFGPAFAHFSLVDRARFSFFHARCTQVKAPITEDLLSLRALMLDGGRCWTVFVKS